MSKPLKFGIRQLHVEQELNTFGPQIIGEMVHKTLERCQPDWKTFELKIELDNLFKDDTLALRLTVMGEPR